MNEPSAAFRCGSNDIDESAGMRELEPDPDLQRDWDRDTEALDAIEATPSTREGTVT